jgi:hypothetical protein
MLPFSSTGQSQLTTSIKSSKPLGINQPWKAKIHIISQTQNSEVIFTQELRAPRQHGEPQEIA